MEKLEASWKNTTYYFIGSIFTYLPLNLSSKEKA